VKGTHGRARPRPGSVIQSLRDKLGKTAYVVSHSVERIFSLKDRLPGPGTQLSSQRSPPDPGIGDGVSKVFRMRCGYFHL